MYSIYKERRKRGGGGLGIEKFSAETFIRTRSSLTRCQIFSFFPKKGLKPFLEFSPFVVAPFSPFPTYIEFPPLRTVSDSTSNFRKLLFLILRFKFLAAYYWSQKIDASNRTNFFYWIIDIWVKLVASKIFRWSKMVEMGPSPNLRRFYYAWSFTMALTKTFHWVLFLPPPLL